MTPERQAAPTTITDTLTWTTDVRDRPHEHDRDHRELHQQRWCDRAAVLDFGKVPVHLFVDDGQRVMIQNCNSAVLELDPRRSARRSRSTARTFPTTLDAGGDRDVLRRLSPHAHARRGR